MAFELACEDLGMADCDFVAKGQTMDELMASGAAHGKSAHGMTDAQMQDPKLGEAVKAAVRQVA
ncbi:MAG: DUF1059 domain-containing protein [Dehalococcoidia bacterium]|nr:DUF1059 domain-containing protein [Dehalococcoidia bacterium]